jgi:hypothetical protein
MLLCTLSSFMWLVFLFPFVVQVMRCETLVRFGVIMVCKSITFALQKVGVSNFSFFFFVFCWLYVVFWMVVFGYVCMFLSRFCPLVNAWYFVCLFSLCKDKLLQIANVHVLKMRGSCFHFDSHCFIHIHFVLCILWTTSLYMFAIFCIVYIFQV